MSDPVPTKQEMFDKAVRGLAARGWTQAVVGKNCVYLNAKGERCAWGLVDESLADEGGNVQRLHERGIGLAGRLSTSDAMWATQLQKCHDSGPTPEGMERNFINFGAAHGLTWPAGAS